MTLKIQLMGGGTDNYMYGTLDKELMGEPSSGALRGLFCSLQAKDFMAWTAL